MQAFTFSGKLSFHSQNEGIYRNVDNFCDYFPRPLSGIFVKYKLKRNEFDTLQNTCNEYERLTQRNPRVILIYA